MKKNLPMIVLLAVLVVAGFVIAWFITGGDVRCMFADDPALCATLRDVGGGE